MSLVHADALVVKAWTKSCARWRDAGPAGAFLSVEVMQMKPAETEGQYIDGHFSDVTPLAAAPQSIFSNQCPRRGGFYYALKIANVVWQRIQAHDRVGICTALVTVLREGELQRLGFKPR
jgi:hypothetical protein